MTSKKTTIICTEFDKVGTIQNPHNDQSYTFWRPRAPPGFAILGDYLTPTSKPPTKGVLAVNTNFFRVKRPASFKLIWPSLVPEIVDSEDTDSAMPNMDASCSVWLPEAPSGFVALSYDPYFAQSPSTRCSNTAVLDVHRARWTALFDQMDKALTEEGKHLESWLNQVKEMQLQCQRGLQYVNLHSLQSLGRPEIDSRPRMEFAERDLAVRAAAASIYSTCNFVKTTEDVSCF